MASVRTKIGSGMTPAAAVASEGGTVGTVAAAGSASTNATALVADSNYVTGANGTTGVILTDAEVNSIVRVYNFAGSNLIVYPPSGHQLNNLTATSGSVTIAANKGGSFQKLDATNWGVMYS